MPRHIARIVRIVLVGGGHSHVGVLRSFGIKPLPNVQLTLICTDMQAPYSGMLPGYVAGHYSHADVHIDLPRLAAFANARLVHDEVIGIDRHTREVACRSGLAVPYDWLSINIGSTPQVARVPGAAEHTVAVKPIARFNARWLALLARVRSHAGRATTIAVVGAGAGGVELLLAMQHRLTRELHALGGDAGQLRFHLVTQSDCILPTHNAGVRARFNRVLAARGVQVHCNAAVQQVRAGQLLIAEQVIDADEIVWVTQAGGAPWLAATGLACDVGGFVEVNDCLQSVSDARIFAAGDIAAMVNRPLEKAGVFAVRQAAPLAFNLRASVAGEPLRAYRPQRHWLALISTGNRYAVASKGWIGFGGRWVWWWKDWVDRGFMRRFRV